MCFHRTLAVFLFTIPLLAVSPDTKTVSKRNVAVCLETPEDPDAFFVAKRQASQIFKQAGIALQWHGKKCPTGAIRVGTSWDGPPPSHSDGIAVAFAPEMQVVLFYPQLKKRTTLDGLASLLAHVLVHEITHILQKVNRHSLKGIMKTNWDETDYRKMEFSGLGFTEEDIELIHRGMDSRPNDFSVRNIS